MINPDHEYLERKRSVIENKGDDGVAGVAKVDTLFYAILWVLVSINLNKSCNLYISMTYKECDKMEENKEIKEVEAAENKLKGKKCPKCGHKSLTYNPFKKTEDGLRPAYCKCSNCGYSTPVVDFDGEIIGIGW